MSAVMKISGLRAVLRFNGFGPDDDRDEIADFLESESEVPRFAAMIVAAHLVGEPPRCSCECDPDICDHPLSPGGGCTRPAGFARADMLGHVCDECSVAYLEGGYLAVGVDALEVVR